MDDTPNAFLDAVIGRTAEALKTMAAHDIPPDEALAMLIGAYITGATLGNQAENAACYAVALHRLVKNQERIRKLEDRVAMLQQLDVIRDL